MFRGLPIYENLLCVRNTDKPKVVFKRRPWMRDSYHHRIQKKRTKRFGFVQEPTAIMMRMGGRQVVICHPSIAAQLRAASYAERFSIGVPFG